MKINRPKESILVCCILLVQIFFCFFPKNLSAASSNYIPWSGYWWPYNWGGLATGFDYRGHPAPLEKYLLLTTGQSDGPLISWYKSRYYDPDGVDWSGLCIYWARAAIMEQYEIFPSSEDNIIFRVGDKKGLLTMCHDADMMTRAAGSNPVTFHYWVLSYIGDEKTSFTADLDAGEEMWFFPVFQYAMSSTKQGLVESVTTTIYYSDDNVDPDYIGASIRQKTYTYNLFLDSSDNIIGGEWTGSSVSDHPDSLGFPLTSEALCPYLDCDEVRRIARAKDDYLEADGNAAVPIAPGTYNLVLMNEDQYVLDGLSGDEIYINLVKDDSSTENMVIDISDNSGVSIFDQTLASGSLGYQFTMENPPYNVSFTQNNYRDPNIYTLTVDKLCRYRQNIPFIPKSGEWVGFAITNSGNDTAEDVMLTTCSKDGLPLQTVWGPLDLKPGEKHLLNFDALPWRDHEYPDTDSLVLLSNSPVSMVSLFGSNQHAMAGFGDGESQINHIVIPDSYNSLTSSYYMQGAIINGAFKDSNIIVRLYSADGELDNEISDVIPPGEKIAIYPGQNPFYHVPDGGWMDITSTSLTPLSGYQYIKYKSGRKDVRDTLFALPVRAGTKIVPHITIPLGRWNTFLTIINPNNTINKINLHPGRAGNSLNADLNLELGPFEKQIINLSNDFGKSEGDSLFHSILKISGEYPIAGYYTFSPSNGGDDASYPLLDENSFRNELVMPHHAGGDGRWWTGVGVCNPNQLSVQVLITPYDANGDAMARLAETIQLSAGAYDVFNIGEKYGNEASNIAFMKITVAAPDSMLVGGFYLYANQDNHEYGVVSTLGGANM